LSSARIARFYFARDLLQNVAGFDDVFLFLGDGVRERRMPTFTSPNRSLASSAWGLVGYFWIKAVRAARASRNFSVLAQFGRLLKFRQGQIDARFGRDFAALLFTHLDIFLENKVVSEPGGAAENDNCEKQDKRATSWIK